MIKGNRTQAFKLNTDITVIKSTETDGMLYILLR